MRKQAFAGLFAVGLVLGGCGQNTDSPAAAPSESAEPSPDNAPGISMKDAIVRLPAVSSAPGVAYFSVAQSSGTARKIAGIYVDGAERAEMHETVTDNGVSSMRPVKEVAIEPGKPASFAPGGLHVMLFGVTDTLKAGGTTEITVTLDNGDKVSTTARIESIGGGLGSDDMGGMDHDMSDM